MVFSFMLGVVWQPTAGTMHTCRKANTFPLSVDTWAFTHWVGYISTPYTIRKNTSASPVELQRARCGSDGTGLIPPTLPAAHAATRPTISRVSLHEEGRLAVVVHRGREAYCPPLLFIFPSRHTTQTKQQHMLPTNPPPQIPPLSNSPL